MSAKLEKTQTPGIYRRGGRYVVVFRDPQGRQRKRFARTLAEARGSRRRSSPTSPAASTGTLSTVTFAEYAPRMDRHIPRPNGARVSAETTRGLPDAT